MSSLACVKTYGVPKSALTYCLENSLKFPTIYRDLLCDYHILYWRLDYFVSRMAEGMVNGYHVKFHKSITSLGYLKDAMKNGKGHMQIGLSFRKAIPEYNLPAYVIVFFRSWK